MKEPTLEEARQVIAEYPYEDDYVQAHYANGLDGHNEYWDNTIETSHYWNQCRGLLDQHILTNQNPND